MMPTCLAAHPHRQGAADGDVDARGRRHEAGDLLPIMFCEEDEDEDRCSISVRARGPFGPMQSFSMPSRIAEHVLHHDLQLADSRRSYCERRMKPRTVTKSTIRSRTSPGSPSGMTCCAGGGASGKPSASESPTGPTDQASCRRLRRSLQSLLEVFSIFGKRVGGCVGRRPSAV